MKGPFCTSHLSPVCAQTHTHTSVHMHRLNPSTPPLSSTHTLLPPPPPRHHTTTAAAGLSEVSVISCSARLNYDVNKSPLDPTSTPTSHGDEGTYAHMRTRLCVFVVDFLFWPEQNILTFQQDKHIWVLSAIYEKSNNDWSSAAIFSLRHSAVTKTVNMSTFWGLIWNRGAATSYTSCDKICDSIAYLCFPVQSFNSTFLQALTLDGGIWEGIVHRKLCILQLYLVSLKQWSCLCHLYIKKYRTGDQMNT